MPVVQDEGQHFSICQGASELLAVVPLGVLEDVKRGACEGHLSVYEGLIHLQSQLSAGRVGRRWAPLGEVEVDREDLFPIRDG